MVKRVSAKELAERLSLDEKTVLKYSRCGILPRTQFTKRCVRFDLEECERIIRGLTTRVA